VSVLPHASGRLIVVLSDSTAYEAATTEARRVGPRLRPLVPDRPLEGAMLETGPAPLFVGTPVHEAGGIHPWDAAHEAVRNAAVLESAVPIEYAEPDFLQQFPFQRPGDTGLEAAREPCTVDPMNDHWPPKAVQFGWHLGDEHSGLKAARELVADPGASRLRIGILDTGFDPAHAAAPRYVATSLQRNFVEDDRPDDATDPGVHFPGAQPGHGTATIALLAGNRVKPPLVPGGFDDFLGGAPFAEVVPIRIASSVIHFYTSAMARGLDYAVDVGCHVLSISMGGVPSRAWARAVNRAYERGMTIVAAAGNNIAGFPTTSLVYPARFHRVIAACGATFDKAPYFKRGHRGMMGNFGPVGKMKTAMAAYTPNTPWAELGCRDVISLNGGGTSSATPQIAAAAALWLQHQAPAHTAEPWRRVEAVRHALFGSADARRPKYFGKGLLRARQALDVAPALDLEKTPEDEVSFPWIRMLLKLEAAPAGRLEMYEMEALQLYLSSPRLQQIVGGADPDVDTPSAAESEKLFEALKRHPATSRALRSFLETGRQ